MILLPRWRSVLKRSLSVWAQAVQAAFGLLSFIDPGAALAVWNMMPPVVASRVPPAFVSAVGAVLFAWALLTILLRVVRQSEKPHSASTETGPRGSAAAKQGMTMTTTVKIHVNGKYRATVTQDDREPVIVEGNYNGGSGEKHFHLPHPANGTFTVTEEHVAEGDERPAE